jgi:hypothetical protein
MVALLPQCLCVNIKASYIDGNINGRYSRCGDSINNVLMAILPSLRPEYRRGCRSGLEMFTDEWGRRWDLQRHAEVRGFARTPSPLSGETGVTHELGSLPPG